MEQHSVPEPAGSGRPRDRGHIARSQVERSGNQTLQSDLETKLKQQFIATVFITVLSFVNDPPFAGVLNTFVCRELFPVCRQIILNSIFIVQKTALITYSLSIFL